MTPRTEHDLQCNVVQFLMLCAPSDLGWRAIPNGSYRSKRTAGRLKGEGVQPGVGDLHFTLPGGRTAWIELKTDAGRLSPEQRTFREAELSRGALYAVCRSLNAVIVQLEEWGVKFRGRVAA